MLDADYQRYEVPDKTRESGYFNAWIEEMHELGYESDHRLLRSAACASSTASST